ncbi:MAG: thioesterase family protein [Deltaproteobacteria bacterium]|nr:MAG: thioesterase family protein [Deltaproteobacteria bacterium]
MADLRSDTAVTRLDAAPGWYTAHLPDRWNFVTPSGGVLMTVAMRAMQAELDDSGLRPVGAHTVFCSPVPHGPLEVRVEVLRRGNAAAQVRAALSSTAVPGPGLEVTATFARDRTGPDVLAAAPPPARPVDAAPDLRVDEPGNPHERYAFFRNFDVRLAIGDAWWRPGWTGGTARHGRWYRYLTPQCDRDGLLDPLALPPIADTMPSSLVQYLGPDAERFHAPSLDLTVHFVDDTARQWLLVSTYCRRARAGYATAEAEIWTDDGRLVAFATQTMMLRRRRAP